MALAVVLLLVGVVGAASPLRVGLVTDLEPFVFADPAGRLRGFDRNLLDALAGEMKREVEPVLFATIPELLDALAVPAGASNASLDFALSALSVTLPRQQAFDFSQPYFDSGLAVLVSSSSGGHAAIVDALFSPLFLLLIFIFVLGLLVFGHCLWLCERRTNSERFDGVWWASVTATTVGYGDISPHSRAGKLAAIFIMFWGLVVTSFLSRVGIVMGQASADYATTHIPAQFHNYVDLNRAVDALLAGELDAIVDDAPLVLYFASKASGGRAKVVGDIFNDQRYAAGLPFASPIAEELNVALAKLESDGTIASLYQRWFVPTHGETGENGSDQINVSHGNLVGFGTAMGVVLTMTLVGCIAATAFARNRDAADASRLPSTPGMADALVAKPGGGCDLEMAPLVPPRNADSQLSLLTAEVLELKAMAPRPP
ncbi:extracellular solute-binding protein family 3 [Thecamonas trahens ATCC 50062]|uniref:Extracellular solute-binding protein family 3 n=1 Tax=Thecamonas trahens ATCC 50062 TaxID=461836 RepID=A0A0L0DNK6_THETB|nr:extracellular solute-binding protein family 3 [Thecamonas trahens ATCC 50062]KNC53850.1 extracellular solute-binding protein family 3 [Thecamonas trahens ATCC 50062]|eukprot:XP_013754230.1 extracellular solute-binding protein family 3 [Thecamonas trahens ATCC 50062]